MESLTQKLRNRRLRQGVASGLNASASTPTSGTTSGDNSTGASAASAEVIQYLDSCFDDMNAEGSGRELALVHKTSECSLTQLQMTSSLRSFISRDGYVKGLNDMQMPGFEMASVLSGDRQFCCRTRDSALKQMIEIPNYLT